MPLQNSVTERQISSVLHLLNMCGLNNFIHCISLSFLRKHRKTEVWDVQNWSNTRSRQRLRTQHWRSIRILVDLQLMGIAAWVNIMICHLKRWRSWLLGFRSTVTFVLERSDPSWAGIKAAQRDDRIDGGAASRAIHSRRAGGNMTKTNRTSIFCFPLATVMFL